MKHIRITLALLTIVGLLSFATPARAQEPTTKQAAAVVAVNLGYLTYQAHAIKEISTAADQDIENVLEQIMTSYSEKLNNVTLGDLNSGKLPELDSASTRKLAQAFIANQKEFSVSDIDMSAAQEAAAALLQQLIMSLMLQ